jgi:hypothetical protein
LASCKALIFLGSAAPINKLTMEPLAKLEEFCVHDSVQHWHSICFWLLILSFVLGVSATAICFVFCRVMEFTRMLYWGKALSGANAGRGGGSVRP